MKIDWKNIASKATKLHNEFGISAVNMEGQEVLSEDIPLYRSSNPTPLAGKTLTSKQLRKYTWENRKDRALSRSSAVLWT